ncbi:deoxyguanosinetriphosphate triphosphohydrolase [Shewanella mangrovi]|uniref:Probable deoxyguanosinetriphosphate triphosphohydrolase n=1 Tax=Shewanella mangrovi TaxID=1515746 RepID=A0A094JGU5_9GAMM|nr:dGTPase [Shewanella mangrovi]KFZ38417.1 deoxyguanosinetriphosphate triphosphohydrolase [Shewanella mangrovi]
MKPDFRKRFSLKRPFSHATSDDCNDDIRALQRAYESDRGRIINSAAIRRLQQKTQVFALERNAAVRSRLTHSLEVQQTGRFIVQRIYELLGDQAVDYGLAAFERCMETLVEMACLMHDVGNPPFGHFGEAAISDWFEEHIQTLNPEFCLQYAPLRNDACHFEGNAQAIRLMHSLLALNLTYSQIAGILKYTRAGDVAKADAPQHKHYLMKKVGYYASERTFVQQLWQQLNIDAGNRHPVSYIMEAADDISYCLADIEDAVEKGVISLTELQQALCDEYQRQAITHTLPTKHLQRMQDAVTYAQTQSSRININHTSQFFTFLRVKLIHPLVSHAAQAFIENIQAVYRGDLNRALLEDGSFCHAIAAALKQVAIDRVFSHREVEKLELQGYRIITALLDSYAPLLALSSEDFLALVAGTSRKPLIAARLLHRLPQKHLATYKNAIKNGNLDELPEFYHRCRLVQDYISGMTDQFAQDEYRLMQALD